MTTLDRVLIASLSIGVWVLFTHLAIQSAFAQGLDRRDVQRIVENCSVSGDVYVYEISESDGYGEISSADISC